MSDPTRESSPGDEQGRPPQPTRRRGPGRTGAEVPAERQPRAAGGFPDHGRYAFRDVLDPRSA